MTNKNRNNMSEIEKELKMMMRSSSGVYTVHSNLVQNIFCTFIHLPRIIMMEQRNVVTVWVSFIHICVYYSMLPRIAQECVYTHFAHVSCQKETSTQHTHHQTQKPLCVHSFRWPVSQTNNRRHAWSHFHVHSIWYFVAHKSHIQSILFCIPITHAGIE